MTYDDCKKQVAEKHGYSSWKFALRRLVYDGHVHSEFENLVQMETEAAELYAKSKANEAVKEDREKYLKSKFREGSVGYQLEKLRFDETPLPYPEEQ